MIQHQSVRDILQKRDAYLVAKQAFLNELLSNPKIYTLPREALDSFLWSTVGDNALIDEIHALIVARKTA